MYENWRERGGDVRGVGGGVILSASSRGGFHDYDPYVCIHNKYASIIVFSCAYIYT